MIFLFFRFKLKALKSGDYGMMLIYVVINSNCKVTDTFSENNEKSASLIVNFH